VSAAIRTAPLPEKLDDCDAYDLIYALAVKKDTVADCWLELLAKWALAKAERVDELEDELAAFRRAGLL